MRNDISINQNDPTTYVEGVEDVKQCWWNILRTIPGSVPMMPTFGCDIFKYMDKPVTENFSEAANKIISALTKWESRAKIKKVTRTVEGSRVYINIVGIYTSTGESIISKMDLSTLFTISKNVGIGYYTIGTTNVIG